MEASGCGHRSDMNLLMTIGGWGGWGMFYFRGAAKFTRSVKYPGGGAVQSDTVPC